MAKKKSKEEGKVSDNYFKRIFQIYIGSFKNLNKDYLLHIFYDLLFVVFLSIVSYIVGTILAKYTGSLAALQTMDSVDIQNMEQLKSAIGTIFLVLIVAILLFIAGWSLAKTLIYNKIFKNKFNWKVYLKFFLFNLAISIIFIIIIGTMPTVLQEGSIPVFGLLVILVMSYFITIFYIIFFKLNKFGKAFSATINAAIMHVHKYFLPFIICGITILIVLTIFSTIFLNIVSGTLSNILTVIFLLFVIAWARLYFVKIVDYIQ